MSLAVVVCMETLVLLELVTSGILVSLVVVDISGRFIELLVVVF